MLNKAWVVTLSMGVVGLSAIVGLSKASASGYRLGSVSGSGVPIMDFLKKSDSKAIQGVCVPPIKNTAAEILSDAGVRPVDATVAEAKTLAKGIQQIERLAGGNFEPIRGAKMQFYDGRFRRGGFPFGRFNGSFVEIHRAGSNSDTNLAHLMHELGHWVGSRDGLYDKYKEAVSPCQYSSYAKFVNTGQSPRNEEFAEVFAAFITHPEILSKGSPNCQRAYNFFAMEVFATGKKFARCSSDELPSADDLTSKDKPIAVTPPAPMEKPAATPTPAREKPADKTPADKTPAVKVEFKLAPKTPPAKPVTPAAKPAAPAAKPAAPVVSPAAKPAVAAKPVVPAAQASITIPRFRTRPVHPVAATADPSVAAHVIPAAKPAVVASPVVAAKPAAPSVAKPVEPVAAPKPVASIVPPSTPVIARASVSTLPAPEQKPEQKPVPKAVIAAPSPTPVPKSADAASTTSFWSW
jgi:hypothetical protein